MFRGVATLNLDSKGRLAVPSRYRDALQNQAEGRVVVTADPSQCLLLFPLPEWEPIEKKLNSLSSFNPQTRSLQRLLVGNAHDLDLDASGRILLPAMLRDFAGLEKTVVLVGQGVKFELWSEARWQAQMEQALVFRNGDMPPELEGFSL
ncbi:MAG: division/cell wall cluster transcriptional repressor MraZ [Pseudomonadota bacterium]|uniref:division/cell wall cluster transcriptional repressor MraZ n=1 Tax=Sulfuriferula sp. TaxID=2025307 RepID=UPI000EC62D81|nr:division/cell wall cluster transcriptional repressor MraZ [Sulfuriferula sp.]MDP2024612.1 division/cell wall cluster transcriptional repressor MraZ [Sulfuriferula sp.]HAN57112.1 cell division/cell wall cluster transcriptional repressor MraZ [Betaproteobacteria bacterium]